MKKCVVLGCCFLIMSACQPKIQWKTLKVEAKIYDVVSAPAKSDEGTSLGTGWYANIEIDSENKLHIAYTDANVGDVFYLQTDLVKPDFTDAERVEYGGAVGSYLHLALAPANVPILSYYHQDKHTLRLAYRPGDLIKMQKIGVDVDLSVANIKKMMPDPLLLNRPEYKMGEKWQAEEITFGDNVGIGGNLFIDSKGFPYMNYYSLGERMRFARREKGKPAFGEAAKGYFTLTDIDGKAGSSYSMSTGFYVEEDKSVLMSYSNWNYSSTQLKLALLDLKTHKIVKAERELRAGVDGWHSQIVSLKNGVYEIYFIEGKKKSLARMQWDSKTSLFSEVEILLPSPGPFKVIKDTHDDIWVLTRGLKIPQVEDIPGLWLIKYPKGGSKNIVRYVLEKGEAIDPWIELELSQTGKIVAAWTRADHQGMRLYIQP